MADLIARQQTASLLAKTQIAARYGGNGVAAAAATPAATAPKTKLTTPRGDVATISLGARRAAAHLADARKDFGALANEVRASLDSRSQGSTGLEALSGRALAAIALDHGNIFSRTEVVAAKAELQPRGWRDRTRSAAAALVAQTLGQTQPNLFDLMG